MVMGQGIQVANSKTAEANSQQTAAGSQFADSVQRPVDLPMELSPIPENSGNETNCVAPDSHHFEVDSEDHSQNLPVLQASKASSHSCTYGIGCRLSKDRYFGSLMHSTTRLTF